MTQRPLDVASDIVSHEPPADSASLWWLGQASLALKGAGTLVYVDPFLSEGHGRLIPPPFSPEGAPPADLVLITHEHLDHLDPGAVPSLAESSPNAIFVAPQPILDQLHALGVPEERVVGVQPGEQSEVAGVRIRVLPAMHGRGSPPAAYGFGREESGGLYRYVGYMIELGAVRLYHSGDTLVFDGLEEQLAELEVDVAFLPINGRTYYRERMDILGNMDEREAAELAAAAGVRLLVPIHYDMFGPNLGRPGELVRYAREHHPELLILVPAHFRRFTYTR